MTKEQKVEAYSMFLMDALIKRLGTNLVFHVSVYISC